MTRLRFYDSVLGPKLGQFVAHVLDHGEQEQLALFEELAVMRGLAGDALQLRAAVASMPDYMPDGKTPNMNKLNALANANSCVAQALDSVRVMAKTTCENFINAQDKYSVAAIAAIVSQFKTILHHKLEENHPEILDSLVEAIDTTLRMPKPEGQGTTILPSDADEDARMMDATIPLLPPMQIQ